MSLKETPVKILRLENGLELKLYDRSRKIAGDRWRVSFSARTEIPLSGLSSAQTEHLPALAGEIEAAAGNCAVFEHKAERNFVAENEKEEIFNSLCDSFLKNSLS